MNKIEFKNLPDRSTPISAEMLNQLQNNIEDEIKYRASCMTAYYSGYSWSATIAAYGTSKINLNASVNNTSQLTLTDGGIKIGAGISKIRISGQCAVYRGTTGGYGIRIYKNNDVVASADENFTDWTISTFVVANRIIEVSENDMIYLYIKSNSSSQSTPSLNDASIYGYLTVAIIE